MAASSHGPRFGTRRGYRRDRPHTPGLAMEMYAAQIGWLDGPRPRFSAALLLVADADGLLILADEAPPVGHPAVLRVPGLLPRYWVETRTVTASRLRSGPYEVRLDFTRRPCCAFLAATSSGCACRN